jgi:hypothetical protein
MVDDDTTHHRPLLAAAQVASVVVGKSGARLFVKAAPVGDGLGEAVQAGRS